METEPATPQPAEQTPSEVELPLPADNRAPGVARQLVRDRWPELDDGVLEDVTLIVSELVSNAVQHGQPEILVRIRVEPFAVDVSVLDHGERVPALPVTAPDVRATSGRGLSIVDRLARDWGIEPLDGGPGKAVWARLGTTSHTRAPA